MRLFPGPGIRTVAWSKDDPAGVEFAAVDLRPDRLRAQGVAIGSDPETYRLDYELATGVDFIVTRLMVMTRGTGWSRRLELHQPDRGNWTAEIEQFGVAELPDPGGDLAAVRTAIDPDLGLSPLFNTLPVLRHGIHRGGSHDGLMVWVSVPDLSLHPSPQRYTHLGDRGEEHIVRFEAAGEDDEFVADIVFDHDGLVIDYPGVATRARGRRERRQSAGGLAP